VKDLSEIRSGGQVAIGLEVTAASELFTVTGLALAPSVVAVMRQPTSPGSFTRERSPTSWPARYGMSTPVTETSTF